MTDEAELDTMPAQETCPKWSQKGTGRKLAEDGDSSGSWLGSATLLLSALPQFRALVSNFQSSLGSGPGELPPLSFSGLGMDYSVFLLSAPQAPQSCLLCAFRFTSRLNRSVASPKLTACNHKDCGIVNYKTVLRPYITLATAPGSSN